MNKSFPSLLAAALLAPLLGLSLQARAIDIKITNKDDPAPPCILHMGTSSTDALQTDQNGQLGDLKVAGTFSPGDPCISGEVPHPLPTGTVSLPPGAAPTAGVPFGINWTAQSAVSCAFTGNGWSGTACGPQPACNNPASGTKTVTLAEGSYNFSLTCNNGVDPAVIVDTEPVVVVPASTETCGYGLPTGTQRQSVGDVRFLGFTNVYHQPLVNYGDLFGFSASCTPGSGGACTNVIPFPGLAGPAVQITAETAKYISLAFTTAQMQGRTAGNLTVSTSNQVPNNTKVSFSDRCGDFDQAGAFLASRPACIDVANAPKEGFRWAIVPSGAVCSLTNAQGVNDPNKVWYLNIRVNSCNDPPGSCRVMYNNN